MNTHQIGESGMFRMGPLLNEGELLSAPSNLEPPDVIDAVAESQHSKLTHLNTWQATSISTRDSTINLYRVRHGRAECYVTLCETDEIGPESLQFKIHLSHDLLRFRSWRSDRHLIAAINDHLTALGCIEDDDV